jgi:hypothetical protein
MPCEIYQEALIELAATGAEPDRNLRTHLDGCVSCRAALRQEQSLFSSIDVTLRHKTSAEVPTSLLPGLRQRLAQEALAARLSNVSWMYVTTAAIATSVVLALPVWRPRNGRGHIAALERPPSVAERAPEQEPLRTSTIAIRAVRRNPMRPAEQVVAPAANVEPEVLVPSEEREALAKFISSVAERHELAVAFVNPAARKEDQPLRVELLQIARLEVKDLEEEAMSAETRRNAD